VQDVPPPGGYPKVRPKADRLPPPLPPLCPSSSPLVFLSLVHVALAVVSKRSPRPKRFPSFTAQACLSFVLSPHPSSFYLSPSSLTRILISTPPPHLNPIPTTPLDLLQDPARLPRPAKLGNMDRGHPGLRVRLCPSRSHQHGTSFLGRQETRAKTRLDPLVASRRGLDLD
jgi:hypothetical protein